MQRWKVSILFGMSIILLVGFYFYTNAPEEDVCATSDAIEATTLAFSQTLITLEEVVDEGAMKLTALYDKEVREEELRSINENQYFTNEEGIYQNYFDVNGSTGFATGYVPLSDDLRETLVATESLNSYFYDLTERYPFVAQIYYNEIRSFSRVYPSFQTEGMVEANRDLTNYNFFNVAFSKGSESIFINTPYIDPAGKGWVISMVKPVIVDGRLKGVFGVDLSVEALNDLLIVTSGMLIVNDEGDVLTLSEDMFQQAGLKVLKNHRYYSDVDKTISMPDEYNLSKSKIKGFRDMWHLIIDENVMSGEVEFDGKVRSYCAFGIKDYGIYLLHINTK